MSYNYFSPPETNYLPRIVIAIVVVIALGGGCVKGCGSGCGPDYSDGERVGKVWKFSKKGIFHKSWEGELNMGGFHIATDDKGNNAGLVPNIFEFSVTDEAVARKIMACYRAGAEVTLHYKQWFQHPVGQMDTSYDITDVIQVGK